MKKVDLSLMEFSATKIVTQKFHVDDSTEKRYDTILGTDLLTKLGLGIKISEHIIIVGDGPYGECLVLVLYNATHLSHNCYQLIFILFWMNFRLRELFPPWYLPHMLNFVHTFYYFIVFEPFQQPSFLAHLKNLAQMLSSSLSTVSPQKSIGLNNQ